MSVTAMNLAWYVRGLTPAQKVVLVALADHADSNGCRVYPGVKRLSIKTSCNDRTVRRALAALKDMGLIIVVKEARYHLPAEYRIDLTLCQSLSERPVTESTHDLSESPHDLSESPLRPVTESTKPSYNRHDKPSVKTYMPPQEYPDIETENRIVAIRTAILSQVREILHFDNEPRFDSAADALLEMGVGPDHIRGFGAWWKANGHYRGKPALKSFMDNFSEYLASITPTQNGQHPPAKDREGMILEDDTGRFIIRNGKPERIEDDGPY